MPNFRRGPLRPQQFFRPNLAFSGTIYIEPITTSLVLVEFTPTVSTPRLMTPSNAALILTEFAPSVLIPRLLVPGVRALAIATFAPTVSTVLGSVSVSPPTRPLTLTGYPPIVRGDIHSSERGHVVRDTWRRERFPLQPEEEAFRIVDNRPAIIALYQSQAITEEEFVALLAAAA